MSHGAPLHPLLLFGHLVGMLRVDLWALSVVVGSLLREWLAQRSGWYGQYWALVLFHLKPPKKIPPGVGSEAVADFTAS